MSLGQIVPIDDRTVLVLGQELDLENDQPDVANTLLHRVGSTLVMVDTGVTTEFRAALLDAVDQVGPWTQLVLLTTHGHVDHIGNNDLVDELAAGRGVAVQHFVPARDLAQMFDPSTSWGLRAFGATTRTYEELPLERLTVGGTQVLGWTFADGAVQVLRSQGHCAGHVIVHLRDSGVLHLGDEVNGPCGIVRDADQLKIQSTFTLASAMIDEGEVAWLTDGHTPEVLGIADAFALMEGLLNQVVALHNRSLDILDGDREPRALVEAYAIAVARTRSVSPWRELTPVFA